MERHNIDRINELSRFARERELTEDELRERHELRQNYLAAFRAQFRAQMESTTVEYPDGSQCPLTETHKRHR